MAKNVSQSEINTIYCGNQLCDMSGIIDCENKFFHVSNQIETSTFPEINKMYNFRKNKRFVQNNTKKLQLLTNISISMVKKNDNLKLI